MSGRADRSPFGPALCKKQIALRTEIKLFNSGNMTVYPALSPKLGCSNVATPSSPTLFCQADRQDCSPCHALQRSRHCFRILQAKARLHRPLDPVPATNRNSNQARIFRQHACPPQGRRNHWQYVTHSSMILCHHKAFTDSLPSQASLTRWPKSPPTLPPLLMDCTRARLAPPAAARQAFKTTRQHQ